MITDTNTPYQIQCVGLKKKEKIAYTKNEILLAFAAFPIAFCFVKFVLFVKMGFITTLVFALIGVLALAFLKKSGYAILKSDKAIMSLYFLFSIVFSATDNSFIKLLDSVFLVILISLLINHLSSQNKSFPRFLPFVLLSSLLSRPFSNLSHAPDAVSGAVKKTSMGKNTVYVIVGLLVTIPLTSVVGRLLIMADEGVAKMLGNVVDFITGESMIRLVCQLLISIPVWCYLFGMLFGAVHHTEDEPSDSNYQKKLGSYKSVENVIIYSATTPVRVLYLLFFISQASYLLSAFLGKLPDGYSFSEYARRGFFELLAICVINLAILIVINLTAKRSGDQKPLMLKIYSIAICFFTLVIIASSLSKMVMYVSVYGFTQLRIYTAWFMTLCAIIVILAIIKQLVPHFCISKWVSVGFVIMFALLAFGKPDYIIARCNEQLKQSGVLEYYDSSYVYTLSDDAIEGYLDAGGERDGRFDHYMQNTKIRYDDNIYELFNLSAIRVAIQTGYFD